MNSIANQTTTPTVVNSDSNSGVPTTVVQFNPVTQLPIKLTGPHKFALWKAQVSMLMHGHNLFGHLDSTTKAPSSSSSQYLQWFRQDQLIQNALLTSVDTTITSSVASATSSHAAWIDLHTSYANKSQTRIFNLRDRLASSTKDAQPIPEYLHNIKST